MLEPGNSYELEHFYHLGFFSGGDAEGFGGFGPLYVLGLIGRNVDHAKLRWQAQAHK